MQKKHKELLKLLGPLGARENVPMSGLTSFCIGGPARVFVEPKTKEELALCVSAAEETCVSYFIMGNGTNLLVSDEGLDALVIRVGESFSHIKKTEAGMEAGAGARIGALSRAAAAEGLSGLEWASGIPGFVGGAVAMNAGAYTGEMKDHLCRVDYMEHGEFYSVKPENGDFSYRKSAFSAPERVVVAAEFALLPGDSAEIFKRIDEFTKRREEKQPLEFPSAGSVFKRPQGHFTGALIEAAGLKGASVGGAQVSEKHAGFIINKGGATCADVISLIKLVQKRVFETSGVLLETEIKAIGRSD